MLEGTVHPDFWPVARELSKQVRRAPPGGGAAVCVYHRGEPVVDLWGGSRNRDLDPWKPETVSLSYSTTKGVASTVLHVLVDRVSSPTTSPSRPTGPSSPGEARSR